MPGANEKFFGPIIRAAFVAAGLPGELGMAIAKWESGGTFDPNLRSDPHATDEALGGAWGFCQMTFETAQGLGFKGQPQGLRDPQTNAALAAKLCAQNAKRSKAAFGSDAWVSDVAAAYNSGRIFSDPKLPHVTRDTYVPHVLAYYHEYAQLYAAADVCSDTTVA